MSGVTQIPNLVLAAVDFDRAMDPQRSLQSRVDSGYLLKLASEVHVVREGAVSSAWSWTALRASF